HWVLRRAGFDEPEDLDDERQRRRWAEGKHILRDGLVEVEEVAYLQTGFLLSGAVLTETIFSWPGMGQWVVHAIPSNDVPVVQGAVLVFASVFVVVNLAVDLSYAWLDPRIHYR
ncbi:MAG: ABC transporter permease subunit, partial [Anaerolineae bacterium]